jgi:hypothetical protein
VAEFVRLATSVSFRGESRRGVGEVVSLASAAIAAHDLDTPPTETYVTGWASLISWAHTHAKAENRAQWHPLTLLTWSSGQAMPAYPLGERLTLGECLAATRAATDVLVTALSTANALSDWASFSHPGWNVELVIREAVGAGTVDRDPLFEHAFAALSRDDRANNQRVIVGVLRGLDPTQDEIRQHVALLLHVLPTAHGSVTKALVELAVRSGIADDDMIALSAIILARPEKAQKRTLLAHVAKMDSGARDVILGLAASSDDAALALKARSLLGARESSDSTPDRQPVAAGMPAWTHRTEPFRPGLFAAYSPNEAGLDQARSDEETWSRITTEAAYLDLVVRFARRDLSGLRTAAKAGLPPSWYSHVRTPFLLHQWATAGGAHRSYERTSTSYQYSGRPGEPIVEQRTFTMPPPAHLLFTDRLVEESLTRLGQLGELLSTPTRSDGILDVAELAERVRRARAVGYAPYDLVQALLRLGPTTPSDADCFDGLAMAPSGSAGATRKWLPRRAPQGGRDGVEVIRGWLSAGGWRPRNVDFPALEPRTSRLALPLPDWLLALDGVAEMCAPMGDMRRAWGTDEPGPFLGVCPHDAEHLAAMIARRGDQDSVFHAQRLPLIVWSAGPIGSAVHHHLARLLAHPRVDSRLLAAQHAATLAQHGRLSPDLLRDRTLALFHHGELSLARAAHGWAELAALSSLGVVAPAWLATLDAACSASKKPAGLADLLRSTRQIAPVFAHRRPSEWLPDSVRDTADARGSTKAAVEARALVEALQQGDTA